MCQAVNIFRLRCLPGFALNYHFLRGRFCSHDIYKKKCDSRIISWINVLKKFVKTLVKQNYNGVCVEVWGERKRDPKSALTCHCFSFLDISNMWVVFNFTQTKKHLNGLKCSPWAIALVPNSGTYLSAEKLLFLLPLFERQRQRGGKERERVVEKGNGAHMLL